MTSKPDYFLNRHITSVLGLFTAYITEYNFGLLRKNEHFVLKFPNGYGASIIPDGISRRYWELAVLNNKGDICYTSPVTNDVIRWREAPELQEILRRIYMLPPEGE